MIDELLCMEMREGQKKFSVMKMLARITYFIAGSGAGVGTKAIVARYGKKKASNN